MTSHSVRCLAGRYLALASLILSGSAVHGAPPAGANPIQVQGTFTYGGTATNQDATWSLYDLNWNLSTPTTGTTPVWTLGGATTLADVDTAKAGLTGYGWTISKTDMSQDNSTAGAAAMTTITITATLTAKPTKTPPAPARGPIQGHFTYSGAANVGNATASLEQSGWVIAVPTVDGQFDATLPNTYTDSNLKKVIADLKAIGWQIDTTKTSTTVLGKAPITITASISVSPISQSSTKAVTSSTCTSTPTPSQCPRCMRKSTPDQTEYLFCSVVGDTQPAGPFAPPNYSFWPPGQPSHASELVSDVAPARVHGLDSPVGAVPPPPAPNDLSPISEGAVPVAPPALP